MPVVGIISDTHGRLSVGAHDALCGVDCIIHAGDICASKVLLELEAIAPTIAVLGNCDRYDYGPGVKLAARETIDGVKIFVTHRPEDAKEAIASGTYALVVHGHTHVTRDEMFGSCRVVNPGSATRPRNGLHPSVAIVRIEDGAIESVEFVAC